MMATFAHGAAQTELTLGALQANALRAPGFRGHCATCGQSTVASQPAAVGAQPHNASCSLAQQTAARAAAVIDAQERLKHAAAGAHRSCRRLSSLP